MEGYLGCFQVFAVTNNASVIVLFIYLSVYIQALEMLTLKS